LVKSIFYTAVVHTIFFDLSSFIYTKLDELTLLPKASTMAQVLNRIGYRLRKVVKAKPQKKLYKQTTSSTTSKNFRILQQANQSRD
ncbi:hypothetical protein, partial [Nostoc sp.]|uniref:hypothetical protein n=1 Tax=Nostoc sp. TaxID=1180 RepID=UPI003B603B69